MLWIKITHRNWVNLLVLHVLHRLIHPPDIYIYIHVCVYILISLWERQRQTVLRTRHWTTSPTCRYTCWCCIPLKPKLHRSRRNFAELNNWLVHAMTKYMKISWSLFTKGRLLKYVKCIHFSGYFLRYLISWTLVVHGPTCRTHLSTDLHVYLHVSFRLFDLTTCLFYVF